MLKANGKAIKEKKCKNFDWGAVVIEEEEGDV